MKEDTKADQEYMLWILVNQARDLLYQAREDELRKYDITTRQSVVLDIIDRIGEKATASEIARWLLRKPHSIAGVLVRMEKQGLVKRAENPDKKGHIYISLTEKGKQCLEKTMSQKESVHEIMSYLSGAELQEMITSVKALRDKALKRTASVNRVPFP